ncbi:MAG: MATE family efflux transporter [Treponema sp.]|nr:MATE family efflux transporter [Treponema sp.]
MAARNSSTDMTQGGITPLLIKFAMPLLVGNIFQQMYNTVDSFVVGNFVGKEALAAIGATAMLINTLIGFFSGFSTGGSILISQFFGAGNSDAVSRTSHTMVVSTVAMAVILTAAGISLNRLMLDAISTPPDVMDQAADYLHIYFEGLVFLMLYNMGSGILRAVGDSRRPLYILILTSILNVALDLTFVILLGMGIKGVAYATLISQAVSAVLVLALLFKTDECYGLKLRSLRIDLTYFRKILVFGLPGGLQLSITFLSNTFVQSYINKFSSDAIAGWTAFSKIDNFCLLPMQSVSLSVTTFVGQNYGAGMIARAKKGVTVSALLSMAISLVVMILTLAFCEPLISIFSKESSVIYYGTYFLRTAAFFYLIRCLNQVYAGAMRGLGNAVLPTLVLLGSFVLFRQIYLAAATRLTESFFPVALAYPIGWAVCSIAMLTAYRFYLRKKFPG